jgi:hypothetical protein
MLALDLVGCTLIYPDPSYVHESTHLYDAAKLVRSEDFSEQRLLEAFRTFSNTNCREPGISRMTIGTNRRDLEAALATFFPGDGADPAKIIRAGGLTLKFTYPEVAQAWCFDGNATAFVRRNDRVTRYQLRGKSDARGVALGTNVLTMIGFNAHINSPEQISVYADLLELPGLDLARRFRDELEAKTGTPAFLTLRTDPFFVEYEGPTWDLFARDLPEGSAVPFLDRPQVACPPKESGGRCILVTKPPMSPAQAWGR